MAGLGESSDNKELLRQIRELRSRLNTVSDLLDAVSATVNAASRTDFLPIIGVSTDNALARWNKTSGDRVQNSVVTMDDSGNIAMPQGAHDYFLTAAGANDGTGFHRGPQNAFWATWKENRLILNDLDGKGIDIRHNGTSVHQFDTDPTSVGGGEVIFNIGQEDMNFRIYSVNFAPIFHVDGGLNRIGIKTASPGATLDVNGNSILNGTVTVGTSITLPTGATVNELSIDGTFTGNSDSAVPTEKATKTYVDNAVSGLGSGDVVGPASATDNAIARFNLTTGKLIQNSGPTISDADVLANLGGITMSAITISAFSSSTSLGTSNTTLSTQGAVKSYVDTGLAAKVTGPGSATDNAIARFDLTTGKLIQNSAGILSDAGALSGLASIQLSTGTSINEFSTDSTMAGDSDDACPTERAVAHFVKGYLPEGTTAGHILRWDGTSAYETPVGIFALDSQLDVYGTLSGNDASISIYASTLGTKISFSRVADGVSGVLFMDSAGDLFWNATQLN